MHQIRFRWAEPQYPLYTALPISPIAVYKGRGLLQREMEGRGEEREKSMEKHGKRVYCMVDLHPNLKTNGRIGYLNQFSRVLRHEAPLRGFHAVRPRVSHKIVTLVHRCLSGHVPSYLADDCRLVTDAGVRRLRSADTRTLVVGRTQISFGNRTNEHSLRQHLGSGTVCRLI